MEGLIMAGQLILSLAILVTFHEAGHFLAARAFGIKVEKFYLFFDAWGKKLFSFKRGDTEYGIGWLPLGGYVKIAGMIDESVDKEALKAEPQPWEFRSKPAWQRFIVMIGGIVVNVILGYLIFIMYLMNFEKDYVSTTVANTDGIYAGAIAEQIGFEQGDKLISLNGKTYERFNDFSGLEAFFGGEMVVERDGEEAVVTIPGDFFKTLKKNKGAFIDCKGELFVKELSSDVTNAAKAGLLPGDQLLAVNDTNVVSFSQFSHMLSSNKGKQINLSIGREGNQMSLTSMVDTNGFLGFRPEVKQYEGSRTAYSFSSAVRYAFKDSWDVIYYNVIGFGKIFSGEIKAQESVQSIVGIATLYGGTWDWGRFWKLTAMISLILAFMNALPIPALDGGHMVFLVYEMITGKPAPERVLLVAQYIGMALLLLLMVLTIGNDIWRMVTGQ